MKFKRIMSVLLAAVIAFSCCTAAVYAVNDPKAEPSALFGDDLEIALSEQDVVVTLLPEAELVQAAAPKQASDEYAKQLQSVSKPAKGTGTAFTLKDCKFPGFNDQKFFKLLDSLGINTLSGEYRTLPDGTAEIVRIDNALPILLIPTTICGKKVTSIGERAVANGLDTTVKLLVGSYQVNVPTLVFLPATVESIGNMAFANCTRLTNVIASDHVTRIGDMAFAGCINLRRVLFYSDVRQHLADMNTAMYEIFQKLLGSILEDGSIIELLTGKSVALIETAFEKILFYNEYLQEIGKAAFYNCRKLVRFYVPRPIKTICEYAFYDCQELKKFVLNGAKQLMDRALANVKIRELYLADGIVLKSNVFEGSVVTELFFGGPREDLPDLGDINPIVHAVVTTTPEWKESKRISDVVDLDVITDNAAEQENLTFRSLDPETVSVTPDGKELVVKGIGDARLVCAQEENGTLNDGIIHSITIKTKCAEVHTELRVSGIVPYKSWFNVDVSVLRSSNGEDLTPYLKAGARIEWKASCKGAKLDLEAEGSVCRIKCEHLDGFAISGKLDVTATVTDADGNIVGELIGSTHTTIRLALWQILWKLLTIGRY